MTTVMLGVRPANPCCAPSVADTPLTSGHLSAIRDALVTRIDAAADRATRRGDVFPGMPASLAVASCWLAAHGVAAPASIGEATFNWDLTTSRDYLAGLNPAALADEVNAGHTALFGGRHPIAGNVLDAARDLAAAGERLAQARAASLITADVLRARWNANAARRASATVEKEAA